MEAHARAVRDANVGRGEERAVLYRCGHAAVLRDPFAPICRGRARDVAAGEERVIIALARAGRDAKVGRGDERAVRPV